MQGFFPGCVPLLHIQLLPLQRWHLCHVPPLLPAHLVKPAGRARWLQWYGSLIFPATRPSARLRAFVSMTMNGAALAVTATLAKEGIVVQKVGVFVWCWQSLCMFGFAQGRFAKQLHICLVWHFSVLLDIQETYLGKVHLVWKTVKYTRIWKDTITDLLPCFTLSVWEPVHL